MSSLLSPVLVGKDYQVRKDIVTLVRLLDFSQSDVVFLSIQFQSAGKEGLHRDSIRRHECGQGFTSPIS